MSNAREKHLVRNDIRIAVEEKGISRADLAHRCGLSEAELSLLLAHVIDKADLGELRRILVVAQSM